VTLLLLLQTGSAFVCIFVSGMRNVG